MKRRRSLGDVGKPTGGKVVNSVDSVIATQSKSRVKKPRKCKGADHGYVAVESAINDRGDSQNSDMMPSSRSDSGQAAPSHTLEKCSAK